MRAAWYDMMKKKIELEWNSNFLSPAAMLLLLCYFAEKDDIIIDYYLWWQKWSRWGSEVKVDWWFCSFLPLCPCELQCPVVTMSKTFRLSPFGTLERQESHVAEILQEAAKSKRSKVRTPSTAASSIQRLLLPKQLFVLSFLLLSLF